MPDPSYLDITILITPNPDPPHQRPQQTAYAVLNPHAAIRISKNVTVILLEDSAALRIFPNHTRNPSYSLIWEEMPISRHYPSIWKLNRRPTDHHTTSSRSHRFALTSLIERRFGVLWLFWLQSQPQQATSMVIRRLSKQAQRFDWPILRLLQFFKGVRYQTSCRESLVIVDDDSWHEIRMLDLKLSKRPLLR